jgi:hypothetical protein
MYAAPIIAWHWSDADHVQKAGGIGKGHQTNSGFSAQRTAHSTTGWICDAVGLKLHGAATRHENRAGCFYITLPPIVAEDSIVSDTHQS